MIKHRAADDAAADDRDPAVGFHLKAPAWQTEGVGVIDNTVEGLLD
jgi:hypothetical protein